MPASVGYLVIDTTDPSLLVPFWCGLLDVQVDAGVAVEALGLRRIDPGVHRVGGEIEHKGRAFRHARFRTAPAAAGDGRRAQEETGGDSQPGAQGVHRPHGATRHLTAS